MDHQLSAILSAGELLCFNGPQQVARLIHEEPSALIVPFLTLLAIQYGLLKLYRIFIYPHFVSPLRHLPGPKDSPFLIGQFMAMFKAATYSELQVKWANEWPKAPFIRYLGLGNQEILIMNTPEAHKAVLQTYCYDFVKPKLLTRAVGEFTGRGVFFAEGAHHRRLRRILQNTLSIPTLKRITPTLREGASNLTKYLNKELGASDKTFVDAAAIFMRATMDITGVTVLGVKLDNLKSKDPKYNFCTHYHRILGQGPLSGFITSLNTAVPVRWLIPIEANRGYMFACEEIKRLTLECVHQRVREMQASKENGENPPRTGDVLSLIIEERKTFLGTDDEMTDPEIADQLLALIVGGFETTASSLVWAVYVLVTHPTIQTKLRQEIMEFVTTTPNYSYTDVDSLRYLHNFSREVFRRHNAANGSWRESAKDLTICNTFIPKGTPIHLIPAVVNLSKSVWGPYAEDFIPERWDRLSGENATPYGDMSFSHGPRVCIGKHYGTYNFKLMLIELVRNFVFGAGPEIEALGGRMIPVQNMGPSYRPRGEMVVSVERVGGGGGGEC